MDFKKIGSYIAGKRKERGMTQRELAEKLGMSDKSVSKWERGICLPDVSVYTELCGILGITLNEFLAGEDIDEKDVKEKSETNLIGFAKDSSLRQKKLKRVIATLICVILAAVIFGAGFGIYENVIKPRNYIYPLAENSIEMQTAGLFFNSDYVYIFRYELKDEFSEIKIYASEYRNGELIKKSRVGHFSYEDSELNMPSEGIIVITPGSRHGSTTIRVSDGDYLYGGAEIGLPEELGENLSWDEFVSYGRSVSRIEDKTEIEPGKELGITAVIYDSEELEGVPISRIEAEKGGKDNDFVYYFSIELVK